MARQTEFLNLYLPDADEVYNVEKDQNENFEKIDVKLKEIDSRCPYKVGDIYITTNTSNPAVIWAGTTWQKIEGRFLRATESNESAGISGGSDTKTLSVANLPVHSHAGSTGSAGNHTHTQVAHSHTQPAHVHSVSNSANFGSNANSAYYGDKGAAIDQGIGFNTNAAGGENTGSAAPAINANGAHTHTVSIGNTGSGTAFDIKPAYITVHIWKRLS